MVLLVCERGFNLSVMNNLTINSFNAHQILTTKNRSTRRHRQTAPRSNRYSAEILTGEASKLWETAVRLTQPCRDTLNPSEHRATSS